jgi:hypothetical protein
MRERHEEAECPSIGDQFDPFFLLLVAFRGFYGFGEDLLAR